MFSRSLAILLAIVGLYLSAFAAAAQPRGGGWAGRGGAWRGGGGFGAGARWGGARWGGPGGFGAGGPAFGRGFPPARGGFGGEGAGFGPRGFPPAQPAYRFGRGAFGGGDGGAEQDEVRRAVREGRNIPLGQAIEAVRRRAPGRELDAGLEAGPNGRPVYRLRWAGQDGRRQDYIVDAGTGAVLGVQGGP